MQSVLVARIVSAALVGDTEIRKEQPMRLRELEGTTQKIVDECGHEEKGSDKILMAWRAKLGKESNLQSFQIDGIIREARHRLGDLSR